MKLTRNCDEDLQQEVVSTVAQFGISTIYITDS